jgi:hypothetical protein
MSMWSQRLLRWCAANNKSVNGLQKCKLPKPCEDPIANGQLAAWTHSNPSACRFS